MKKNNEDICLKIEEILRDRESTLEKVGILEGVKFNLMHNT